MAFNLSALKVLIKKIFPPNKSVYTVDTTHDGKADSILIRAFNIVIPFELPREIILEGTKNRESDDSILAISDLEVLSIYFDEERIKLPHQLLENESIQENIYVYHDNSKFSLADILEGKLKGRLIKLGDNIDIILRFDENTLRKLTKGNHILKIESHLVTLELNLSLTESNFNVKYPFQK